MVSVPVPVIPPSGGGPGQDLRSLNEFLKAELVDVQVPLQVTVETTSTGEERALAAEVQNCAIELLALQIENELPEWLGANRTELAWSLALAAHSFVVGFMRATGQSPELYAHGLSISSSLSRR